MENFIKYVNIQNFKSIADLKLEDCKRINLFVGYPNVGKSNVLEALGLFSVPFLKEKENLNKLVRVENKYELLHNISNTYCNIKTNLEEIELSTKPSLVINRSIGNNTLFYHFSKKQELLTHTHNLLDCTPEEFNDDSSVKRYIFQVRDINTDNYRLALPDYLLPIFYPVNETFLLPPFGENIIDVLSYNENVSEVKAWIKKEFAQKGLEYLLDIVSGTIKIQRRLNDDKIKQLPYSLIADTLQRMIFYKTAIASNKNSVLLFEEPEAHAFPPYIQTIMQDIIDAESNQVFIVTHSPLVVNAFLEYEKLRKETSIYLFDFKNDQTTAKRLSDEEMELAYEYGDDLFFNLENLL